MEYTCERYQLEVHHWIESESQYILDWISDRTYSVLDGEGKVSVGKKQAATRDVIEEGYNVSTSGWAGAPFGAARILSNGYLAILKRVDTRSHSEGGGT